MIISNQYWEIFSNTQWNENYTIVMNYELPVKYANYFFRYYMLFDVSGSKRVNVIAVYVPFWNGVFE